MCDFRWANKGGSVARAGWSRDRTEWFQLTFNHGRHVYISLPLHYCCAVEVRRERFSLAARGMSTWDRYYRRVETRKEGGSARKRSTLVASCMYRVASKIVAVNSATEKYRTLFDDPIPRAIYQCCCENPRPNMTLTRKSTGACGVRHLNKANTGIQTWTLQLAASKVSGEHVASDSGIFRGPNASATPEA